MKIVDAARVVCPNGMCKAQDAAGNPIYKDEHHMRPFFVKSRFEVLEKLLMK